MKKDIERREILDFGIALVPDKQENGVLWDVYAVNLSESALHNVIINVQGRRQDSAPNKPSTAELRYFYPELAAQSYVHIEVMVPNVAELENRFWVSFQLDDYLYDKKYIVSGETLDEDPDLLLPLIGKLGHWFE